MPLYRGNDTKIPTDAITDEDGNLLTTGTVEIEVLSLDLATTYIAKVAMTHDAAGVWTKTYESTEIDTIPAAIKRAKTRVTVGDPIDATFIRVEEVLERRST